MLASACVACRAACLTTGVCAVQQASEQRLHKLSYHLDKAAVADPDDYLRQLAGALAAAGLDVNLVYSGGRDVDLLALGADKGRALAFLLQQIPAACQPPLGCQVWAHTADS
jgi:hypothetical protein